MITFSIGLYEIMAFTGRNQPVRLYMSDVNKKYRGYIDFVSNYNESQNFILHPNGIINAFMPLEKLHPVLDILRNEKPVFFSLNKQYNWAAIKTGTEPTGEEESRERTLITQSEWA
jgi:hypothetical protein